MQIFYKLSKILLLCFLVLLINTQLLSSKNPPKKAGKTTSKSTIEDVQDIINQELKQQALKRINELIKLSKKNNQLELTVQFAKYDLVSNPNDSSDKVLYAIADEAEQGTEGSIGRVNFFKDIASDCGKMKKVYIQDRSEENEPIGNSISITIPGTKHKGNVSCYHYSVTFRRDLAGKLLITEWYSMPGNQNCQ